MSLKSLKYQDEDSSSGSESDVLRPSKTVAKVPGKVSTLKRSRCDDGGGPSENARSSKCITKEQETYVFLRKLY